ncbi:ribonuclease H-like domain-containing protein [Tanacetum coccineum]|uniref:Ribonuclease H-like domain-containing protein n=1 Tax=Tanacetum coccineum TaxID=301880 RepID=A0ABQ5FVB8_9ASTR
MQNLLSLINDNNFGSIHANMAGIASFFNGNVWFNINFSRNYCANSKLYAQTITLGWVIDSGANQHLTVSTVEMFNVVDITNLKIILGHPNGTLATISHVGNLKLSNNVVLYDVLVIPGYCDLKTEKILGTDSEFGGLYLFDFVKDNYVGKSNMAMCFHVSKLLWHSRLGHPSDQFCLFCTMIWIFPNPLFFLCGPYRVPSREGYKYFVTVVDDYCRADWVYFVKTKDEVFDVFVSFINLLNNQFEVKLKTVRSDNGTEFVNHKMSKLFSELGGIPLKFWSDCILTAVYAILCFKSFEDVDSGSESNHWSFFDNQMSQSPYDEGRVTSVLKDTQDKNSSRPTKLLAKFSDFVLGSNVRYGIEKYSSEPTCYIDDLNDSNLVDAMNNKIEALSRNNTWTICDLPVGRKPIRFKEKVLDYEETFSPVVKMVTKASIEVLDNDKGLCMTQRKYCLELLYEYRLLATKHVDIPLPDNTVLNHIDSKSDKKLGMVDMFVSESSGKVVVIVNHTFSLKEGVQD